MVRDQTAQSRRSLLKKSGAALSIGIAGLAGCTGNNDSNNNNGKSNSKSDGEKLTITFATTQPPENVSVKAAKKHFIKPLEKKSDGRISVDLKAGSLGGTEDNLDALESGTVDILHESPTALAQRWASKYSFAGDPFVIKDMDHYRAVTDKYLKPDDGLNGILKKNGVQLGDAFYVGNRGFTSNSTVKTPKDVQGMKLRLPQYDTWTKVWGEIGADVTPVAYDELYSALQTGVVDASEGPISQFLSVSLYEVQSHFSVTNHLLGTKHFLYNQEFMKGLSDDNRDLVTSTASDAVEKMTDQIKSNESSLYEEAKQKGTTVVPADKVDREAFVNAGMPALKQLSKNKWAVNINDVLNLA
ncbi:TRAP dicarboxylate transporter- DctP subunit [Haladaptatus paucihalophilus DX253]|uniref:TRAP dicarboxylate transporter-DctP subunit n=1 Tax=Haladaptatus paucihalophilus DX253 TaxID=797209 RepID=E7QMJ7_HALPU|nr:TRAP transporter substrate-binding protein [Haladaptatus paucihalophilus]EFW94181.1 TRAP dicarboxylate transporter- DctP subunit [Haladaptatus paucihalophilus DX253]SHL32758.1 tripartite ATP-independent transporter solute receptor, DctP family [Haladaptatus paucihalophilus DX253]